MAERISILYAEDESLTRRLVGRSMRKHCDVSEAENGRQALQLFDEQQFQVLVTDLSMPHMTGFELIEAIRDRHPDFPVIVTTAYRTECDALPEDIKVFSKPLQVNELVQYIRELLGSP